MGKVESAARLAELLPEVLTKPAAKARTPNAGYVRKSVHVPMEDSVRLAVDIFLPKSAPDEKRPTLFLATRYWRAADGDPLNPALQIWIDAGYALAYADVRGTGASFGQWYIPYTAQEVRDVGRLANWIAEQPWSNGRVVMTGNSYLGTTALFGPAHGSPAIRAIAPKFSDFDFWSDVTWPGGASAEALSVQWGTTVRAMDMNTDPRGSVRPVDGPDGKALLAAAVEEHKKVPLGLDRATYLVTYQDERLAEFGGHCMNDGLVHHHQDAIMRSEVPIFGWGSWLDGGVAQGMLARFNTWTNPQLSIIGPWTHGARANANVFGPDAPLEPSPEEQDELILRYFDHFVASDAPAPLHDRVLVYFTMGQDRWKRTTAWPVPRTRQHRLYLAEGNSLAEEAPKAAGADAYRVDFTASAGPDNRWATQAGHPTVAYGDRAEADRKLLVYTSRPAPADLVITGQPVVTLFVDSTHTDGHFIVYLEDVAPDGRVTYLTEGALRALSRKLSTRRPPYKTTYPYRSFFAEDGAPLVPGEVAELTFQLQGTSALVGAGHRLRVAIAGADDGMFLRRPAEEGEVTIHVHHGGAQASFVELPIEPAGL